MEPNSQNQALSHLRPKIGFVPNRCPTLYRFQYFPISAQSHLSIDWNGTISTIILKHFHDILPVSQGLSVTSNGGNYLSVAVLDYNVIEITHFFGIHRSTAGLIDLLRVIIDNIVDLLLTKTSLLNSLSAMLGCLCIPRTLSP